MNKLFSLSLSSIYVYATSNLPAAVTSGPLTALKYTNVGGKGSYQRVANINPGVWPNCPNNPPSCSWTTVQRGNDSLAPFDEDLTLVFAGPLQIYNFAVYQPATSNAASWPLVSQFVPNKTPKNLVVMNNKGGGASGTWSICAGASQSYANGDWTGTVATPNAQPMSGILPSGEQINMMTGTQCTSKNCAGFYRGTANLGWAGSKMMVFEIMMPQNTSVTPAIWILNGQVVRSAQYGCNCRGMGGQGGCGELDLLEVLTSGNPQQAISEIYSYKGATGTGSNNWFPRPTAKKVIYGVIFDVKTNQITIQRMNSWDWTSAAVTRGSIDSYLGADAMVVKFGQ